MESLMSGALTGSAGLQLFAYMLALSAPLLSVLGLALLRDHASGSISVGPGLVLLIAVTYLLVSLVGLSDPAPDPLVALLWALGSFGLFGLWCAVLVPGAWRKWKASGWRGVLAIAGLLLPLPLAAALLVTPGTQDAAQRTRFELSEGALSQHVAEFQRTGVSGDELVGFYRVESTRFEGGCVMLQTSSLWAESGLAYCAQNPPTSDTLVWERVNARWWEYEAVTVD